MKWINKDFIAELGGVNLYIFCSNNAISFWDILGLCYGIIPIREKTDDEIKYSFGFSIKQDDQISAGFYVSIAENGTSVEIGFEGSNKGTITTKLNYKGGNSKVSFSAKGNPKTGDFSINAGILYTF